MARTGRPTRRIEPTSPFAGFATDLVGLRVRAGLSVVELARRTSYAPAVISDAASGKRMPSADVVKAYVRECGGDVAAWLTRRTVELEQKKGPQEKRGRRPDSGVLFRLVTEGRRLSSPAFPLSPGFAVQPDAQMLEVVTREVESVVTLKDLAACLDKVRFGHSYAALARHAQTLPLRDGRRPALPSSTVSDLLSGKSLPSRDTVITFLSVCGVTDHAQRPWLAAWARVAAEADAAQRRVTDVYIKAVEQLGSEKAPVRLGGLYALERLAQDNPDQRSTLIDVLCAYLRMPYTPPGQPPAVDASDTMITAHLERAQEREVRLTAQRILTTHVRPGPDIHHPVSTFWPGTNLDLTGATLINFDLTNCRVGHAVFADALFAGSAWFRGASFEGAADFEGASFEGAADFEGASFEGRADFERASFAASARFVGVSFGWHARFQRASFEGAADFERASFEGLAQFAGMSSAGPVNWRAVLAVPGTILPPSVEAGSGESG